MKIQPYHLLASSSLLLVGCADKPVERPNVLWIMIEDWSTDLSCYGTPGIHTPNIDRLAAQGMLFTNAYTTAPVSSASRSAMMTGYHQTFVGGHQHRTAVADKQALPHGIRPIPHLMREAGYYTQLMSWKTDCNFIPNKPAELFEDTKHWVKRDPSKCFFDNGRAEGQPFYACMSFDTTHRKWTRDSIHPIDPSEVEIPPYYVDNAFVRRDWANGFESMQVCDRQVGELLDHLDQHGLTDNTLVIFIGDNGRCHIRGKQFLYEPGVKVPMIVRWPGHVEAGTRCDHLVSSLDICRTVLDLAGITPHVPLHGMNLLDGSTQDRKYIFASRDKMDETHDAMRSVRSADGMKLIHNLMPERPYLQYNQYKEQSYPVLAEMSCLYLEGKLNADQARLFAPTKPEFELYDLNADPHELHNLANDPACKAHLQHLLRVLNEWRSEMHDQGVSDTFRAENVYPDCCPTSTVSEYVDKHQNRFDYNRHGWPAWYPTRTLEQWKIERQKWNAWVNRPANCTTGHPYNHK